MATEKVEHLCFIPSSLDLSELKTPKSLPLDSHSPSISQSERKTPSSSFSSKPILEPPCSPILRQLETRKLFEELHNHTIENNQRSIDMQIANIHAFHMKELEKAQEILNQSKKSNSWGTLQEVSELAIAATSTVAGLTLLATGGVGAGFLIAGGILPIANFSLKKFGAWEWLAGTIAKDNKSLHQQLSQVIPSAIGLTIAVTSLGGAGAAAYFAALPFGEQVFSIVQKASSFLGIATGTMQGACQFSKTCMESALVLIQTEAQLMRLDLEHAMTQMQTTCQNFANIIDESVEMLTLERQMKQIIHQTV